MLIDEWLDISSDSSSTAGVAEVAEEVVEERNLRLPCFIAEGGLLGDGGVGPGPLIETAGFEVPAAGLVAPAVGADGADGTAAVPVPPAPAPVPVPALPFDDSMESKRMLEWLSTLCGRMAIAGPETVPVMLILREIGLTKLLSRLTSLDESFSESS